MALINANFAAQQGWLERGSVAVVQRGAEYQELLEEKGNEISSWLDQQSRGKHERYQGSMHGCAAGRCRRAVRVAQR